MESLEKTNEQKQYEKMAYSIFSLEFEIALQKEQIKKAISKKEETILRIQKLQELANVNNVKLEELKVEMKETFNTDYDLEF